jgi:hypothetical protein
MTACSHSHDWRVLAGKAMITELGNIRGEEVVVANLIFLEGLRNTAKAPYQYS